MQAMTRDGQLLLTPEQEAAARYEADTARREADVVRQQIESENARLRAELERFRRQNPDYVVSAVSGGF